MGAQRASIHKPASTSATTSQFNPTHCSSSQVAIAELECIVEISWKMKRNDINDAHLFYVGIIQRDPRVAVGVIDQCAVMTVMITNDGGQSQLQRLTMSSASVKHLQRTQITRSCDNGDKK